jgi:hypothetical protein
MGIINYDPDKAPDLPPKMLEEAIRLGMTVVHVMCRKGIGNDPDNPGVTFVALTPGIPRIGEFILLQDGKGCRVENVFWHVCINPITGSPLLVPNVIATQTTKEGNDTATSA